MTTGTELIAAERDRQIHVEGWTEEHDAEHDEHEMLGAAVAYALAVKNQGRDRVSVIPELTFWPHQWNECWWKPTWDDPVRMLAKAGALIAAEIDRLQAVDS